MELDSEKFQVIMKMYKMYEEMEEKKTFKEFLEKEKVKKCYECEMYYMKSTLYVLPEMKMFEENHKDIEYEKGEVFCKKEGKKAEFIVVTKKEQMNFKEKYNKEKIENFEESLYENEKETKNKGKEKVTEWDEKKEKEVKENWNKYMENMKSNWDEEVTKEFGEVQGIKKEDKKVENKKEEWEKVENKKRKNEKKENHDKKGNQNEFNYDEYTEKRKMNYEKSKNNEKRIPECVCRKKERYLRMLCKRCDIGEKREIMVEIIKDIKFMMTEFEEEGAKKYYEKIINNCNEGNVELVRKIGRKEVIRLNEGARKEWKYRLKNGKDKQGRFAACMCVMGENDKRISKLSKERICIIHKHIVEKVNEDWHNCESCAKGWYEEKNDERYWRIVNWMKNRREVEDKEMYPNVYRRFEECKEEYEDFKEWLGEYDGYYSGRRIMSKERADNEEYKFGIVYGCYNCGRNDQKMYWVERKYLCYGCREIKWETIKVYMIKRLEKALEEFKEDFKEIIDEKEEEIIEKQQENIEENKEIEDQFEEKESNQEMEEMKEKSEEMKNDEERNEENTNKIVIGKIEIFNNEIGRKGDGGRRGSI